AFGGLRFGLSTAGDAGWSSPQALVPLSVGTVSLLWFERPEPRPPEPLLERSVLRYPSVSLGAVRAMRVFSATNGGLLLLPLYMQNMSDFTAMESVLVLLPGAAIMGIMSPVTGRIFDHFGAKLLALVGFTLVAAMSFMLS